MDKQEIVTHLCSKGHRGSTTEEEKWAAEWIQGFMREHGLETELLPFRGSRTYAQRLVVHLIPVVLIAFLIPALFVPSPWEEALPFVLLALGFLILSFFIETVLLVEVLSHLTPKRDSVNVLGKLGDSGATRRLLFVAHYDSQREGDLFNPERLEQMRKFASPASRITPIHITFLAVVGLLPYPFIFGMELPWFLFVPAYLIYLGLLLWLTAALAINVQWTTSKRFVPGANDNATGVAIMLDLARKYAQEKKAGGFGGVELWFLATSCEETGMDGALKFIREKGKELKEKGTQVINLDGFGQGIIHYLTADGCLITRAYNRELVKQAEELARESFPEVTPFVCRVFTDGLAFAVKGFKAISFFSFDSNDLTVHHYHWRTDTPENVNFQAVEQAQGFVEAFVRRLVGES